MLGKQMVQRDEKSWYCLRIRTVQRIESSEGGQKHQDSSQVDEASHQKCVQNRSFEKLRVKQLQEFGVYIYTYITG